MVKILGGKNLIRKEVERTEDLGTEGPVKVDLRGATAPKKILKESCLFPFFVILAACLKSNHAAIVCHLFSSHNN